MDAPAGQTVAGNNNDNTAQNADANEQIADAQRSRGSVSSFLFLALLFFLFGTGPRSDDVLTRQQLRTWRIFCYCVHSERIVEESMQSLVDQQAYFSAYLKNETSNFTLVRTDPLVATRLIRA